MDFLEDAQQNCLFQVATEEAAYTGVVPSVFLTCYANYIQIHTTLSNEMEVLGLHRK
jgi:hypothetical protein